jgi:hypothetical protein
VGLESEAISLENEKNLKGNTDVLTYYRLKDTGSFEERAKLIETSNELTTQLYFYPEKDKILFSEKEIRKFSLDKYGQSLPYIDGELTIFNNYFFDFWGYYLTAEGTSLYGHLKRYAYGNKDWSYPKIPLICAKMNKSRSTVLRFLDILEHYGFVYQFGVINNTRKNVEESPVFKIRKQIPLLPKRLIYGDPKLEIPEDAPVHIKNALKREQKGLPDLLKKEHEKFVEKHVHDSAVLEESMDFEQIYKTWLNFGELLKKNKSKQPNSSKAKITITKEMTEQEKILLMYILEEAQKSISKPSFETWFKDILLKIDKKTYTIYAPNEFAKDWLQDHYHSFIKCCLEKIEGEIDNLYFEHF